MAACIGGDRRRWQVVVTAIVTPLLVALGLITESNGSDPTAGMIAASAVGMSQPRLVYLKPGVRIAKKPPTGWSHLVIKSIPRLATGDKGSLPAGSSKTATLFRSVLLANVKPVDINEKDFELTQIGVAICIPDPQDEDQDIVVSGDTLNALGLNHLTTVQRLVLDAAELEMAEGRIIARTATFALFRSPVTIVDTGVAGKHSKASLHYAFCANHATGKLDVAVWTMKPDSGSQQAPATMVKLAADPVFPCELDVRAKRILGTVPYSWSFAMRELPPGRELRVPPSLGALIAKTSRHPAESDPEELERLFIETLSTVPDTDLASDKGADSTTDGAVRRTAIPPPYSKTP
jgi:hypothetical protein